MFCKKCGREIDYESNLCLECTAALAIEAKKARDAEKFGDVSDSQSKMDITSAQNSESNECAGNNATIEQSAEPLQSHTDDRENDNRGYLNTESESRVHNFLNSVNAEPPKVPSGTRKVGLVGAIIGNVLPEVSFLIYNATHGGYGIALKPTFLSNALMIWAIIASVLLGVISISIFRDVKKDGYPTPVATLVLGITSLVMSAMFICFMISLSYMNASVA